MEKSVNILIIIFLPFLLIGLINKVKAFWAGRKGPHVFQPYYDFFKLMRKGQVISTATSLIFQITPALSLAAILVAGFLTPLFDHQAIWSFSGDFVFFAYLLALAKFFSLVSALDTGSSFESMGAAREINFSWLAEPAFFILLGSLVYLNHSISFSSIFLFLQSDLLFKILIIILTAAIFFILLITEGCRVPVDDPNTHLELTMIHEVMILDNSGPDLAFIFYSAALKMLLIGSLLANVLIPAGLSIGLALLGYLSIIILLGLIIGSIESLLARLRMTHVPQFILLLTSLSLIVLALTIFFNQAGVK